MGGQDQWGYGQQQPPQQQAYGAWGQGSPGAPGGTPGGTRPKLTGGQLFCVSLSCLLMIGSSALSVATIARMPDTVDTVNNNADDASDVDTTPSPTVSLPESHETEDPGQGQEEPSPTPSETSSGGQTYDKRGPITASKYLKHTSDFGGNKAKRQKTDEGKACPSIVVLSKYKTSLGSDDCKKYISGSYVSDDEKYYISTTGLQYQDKDAANEAKEGLSGSAQDIPLRFLKPDGYDTSKLGSETSVYQNVQQQDEVLVITNVVYADGRHIDGSVPPTGMSSAGRGVGGEFRVKLLTDM